jgi:cytidine deaminase
VSDMEHLVTAAREIRERAHAPYSGFLVGAALAAGGKTFVGVNIENASYPLSVCAERNAVAAMVSAGEHAVDAVDAVAVVTDADAPTPPCGGCRQVLSEFARPETVVVSVTLAGARAEWTVGGLLPDAFSLDR